MIVNDKLIFKDWFINDEFVERVVDVTKEDTIFIHDLIKRRNILRKNISACLFSVHNTISLSRHELVCLIRLHLSKLTK